MNAIERLLKELNYLHGLLDAPPTIADKSFESLVRAKFHAMKLLKIKQQASHEQLVTNRDMYKTKDLSPFKNIMIGYDNENLDVMNLEKWDLFYPVSGRWLFYSSGQAAVNVTFLYLFERFGKINILNNSQTYHETRHLLEYLSARTEQIPHSANTILVDSISWSMERSEEFLKQLEICEWVVIDSTCWEMNSKEMSWLLQTIQKSGKPAFIIRSHVKLDTLGAEYGLLGSLMFMKGDLSEKDFQDCVMRLRKITSMTRNAASYFSLYPFWKEEITEMIHERTSVLKRNSLMIAEDLKNALPDCKLITFPHGLFCYLDVPCTSDSILTLRKFQSFDQDAFHICDSFGFDHITVLPLFHNEGSYRLRITSSTHDEEDLRKRLLFLGNVISRMTKNA